VIPITNSKTRYFVVLFEENPPRATEPPPTGAAAQAESAAPELQLQHTQRELSQTRDYLRHLIEAHEAATEELKSANEEICSSNEELQSTNEELRTAKEELQSINEELITVNDELQHRNEELNAVNSDLSNVLNASNLPIIMVGGDLRLRRFTRAAERILKVYPADIGRLIDDVRHTMELPDLRGMLLEAIGTLAVQHCRAKNRDGRWYSVFVRPYRTMDDRIDGAVATFIDIDDTTRALERAEQARDYAEAIVETVRHPLLVLDGELRIRRANAAFYKVFQVTREETNGTIISDFGNQKWNLPSLSSLLEEALLRDAPSHDLDIEHDFPNIGRRLMRVHARKIVRSGDKTQTVLLAIEDITERREAAEIQYRRLFETAKDAFLVVDAETSHVVDVNPYFSELTRYPRNEVLGKPFGEIQAFLDAKEGARLVPESSEKDVARYDGVSLRARDGRNLVVDIVANAYRVKDRRFIQINIRDVTERKRGEEAVRRSNLDLQQFAFAASHDLQEPLRTIVSYLQLIEKEYRGKLDAEGDRMIHYVTSAADRMRNMVLDLLSYSQIAQSKVAISPVSMEAVLGTALLNLQMAIQSSNARISFDPLPIIWVDQSQLLQLLQNLIGNALKYRSAEPPRIHISARQAGPEWIISVKDNGIGVEPRFAEHIFTIFKRLHGQEYPGTGIGLAICKRIVERHGGRIWVESEPGKGTTFNIALPAQGSS
jgi:PAS domain S-box-containing protein